MPSLIQDKVIQCHKLTCWQLNSNKTNTATAALYRQQLM